MSIGVHFDDDERLEDEDVNIFSHWDEDWGTNEDDSCSSTPTPENSKD